MQNYFKYQITYKDRSIYERIFDANTISPNVRTNVNIKELIPELRKDLQKVLSLPNGKLFTKYYVGLDSDNKPVYYDLDYIQNTQNLSYRFESIINDDKYNKKILLGKNINKGNIVKYLNKFNDGSNMIVLSKNNYTTEILYKDTTIVEDDCFVDKTNNNKTLFSELKQIEFIEELRFSFNFYLNENIIIKRKFTVFNFNTDAINSVNFMLTNDYISNNIFNYIKKEDINSQFTEYIKNKPLDFDLFNLNSPEENEEILNFNLLN
jgi:hypothetical protein